MIYNILISNGPSLIFSFMLADKVILFVVFQTRKNLLLLILLFTKDLQKKETENSTSAKTKDSKNKDKFTSR